MRQERGKRKCRGSGTRYGGRMRRKLELIWKEKALLELQLARREAKHGEFRPSSRRIKRNDEVRLKLNEIKELVDYFDDSSGSFENWKKQVRFIKRSCNLSNDFTKALVSSKLKRKTIEWFHSRSDFLEVSLETFGYEEMFDHRPAEMILRRQFEQRKWKRDE